MKSFINQFPSDSKRSTFYLNLSDSKRIRWVQSRTQLSFIPGDILG
ncbi:hypothetical protein GGR42_001810 [Saonia flava]|uniref:Uncharacterized protein n=1 Tax=Saonia flava TaxID=523696 RepID=A0A846QTH3_9FLAO|nr:hypothetical protein [Saonia flava]NJB71348.1 hypothetical protein [Saonia flava]